jgi:hypothetical protein
MIQVAFNMINAGVLPWLLIAGPALGGIALAPASSSHPPVPSGQRASRAWPFTSTNKLSVKNPAMTAGKDKPDHWTSEWVGQGKIKVSRDTATYHSAPASLALEAVNGAAQAQVSQSFEVKGGERVLLSGWVRADGGANAMLALQSFTADWKGIDFKVVGNAVTVFDWRND